MTEFVACPTCGKKTGCDAYVCKKCDKICCERCGDKHCPSCAILFDSGGIFGSPNYKWVGTVQRQ